MIPRSRKRLLGLYVIALTAVLLLLSLLFTWRFG